MVQSGSSNVSKVQTDQVLALANSYSASHDEFQGYYRSAQSIRENVAASWTGQSSQVFQEAMVAWENNLNRIMNDFEKMTTLLGRSAGQYVDHDETAKSNATELSSVAQALAGGMS